MKILLKRDVAGTGKANEVVEVADGYARNYLIPKGFAVKANEGRVKAAKQIARSQKARAERMREQAEGIAEQLRQTPVHFTVKAGETGRLYGSITSADVAEAVSKALHISFDKRTIQMERPLREVGEHAIAVKLDEGVQGTITVVVEAEDA